MPVSSIFEAASLAGELAPRSRCGVAAVPFQFPDGLAMAGYSAAGRFGKNAAWTLCARAMVLEDEDGDVVVFVAADLMSASRYLHDAVVERLRRGTTKLKAHQLVLFGTHTHTAPGNFYGNKLYDTVAQAKAGFRQDIADSMAEAIAQAIERAWTGRVPAKISFGTKLLWGVSRNRSLEAFRQNPEAAAWNQRFEGGEGLSGQQRAIDPRVTVLTAYGEDGRRIGTLATFACHNTALGAEQKYYAPDWTGIAAEQIEKDAQNGAPIALIGLSGAGDMSPTPPSDDDEDHGGPSVQGRALADFVGGKVARTILEVHAEAPRLEPIRLKVWHQRWKPEAGSEIPGVPGTRLAAWELGASALAGAEDARSILHPVLAWEGMTSDCFEPSHPQFPKAPALSMVGALVRYLIELRPSAAHPLHVVQIGSHVIGTVPGEPTVCAAAQIEAALRTLPGVSTASVLGFAGDYAGYFTTHAEYQCQHYEGASTLYGGESTKHLTERLKRLASGQAFVAPARVFAAAAELDVELIDAPAARATLEALRPGEATASGAHVRGKRVYAWWAWSAENAPRSGVSAWLEVRSDRLEPVRLEQITPTLGGAAEVIWTAEFELDAARTEESSPIAHLELPETFSAPAVACRLGGRQPNDPAELDRRAAGRS